jgi:hypothetical protein
LAFPAKLRTLNPAENHVVLLHCASEIGLDKLARWYAGEFVIPVGTAPTRDEVSGEGPYIPLSLISGESAASANLDFSHAREIGPVVGPEEDEGTQEGRGLARSMKEGASDEVEAEAVPTARAGYLADALRRAVVETHAVDKAIADYRSRGYEVVELGKPFDLLCTPKVGCIDGSRTVHVEVKGTTQDSGTVQLTRNEVRDANGGGDWRSDLYVISNISLLQHKEGEWWHSAASGSGG